MHRGCFVWTPTPPLAGLRTPLPGSRACVGVLVLPGRVERAGLPGAFWCASPFLWPLCRFTLLGPFQAGVGPFLFLCCLLPSSFVPFAGPRCLPLSPVSGPGCPGPWRLVSLSSLPVSCFFSFSLFLFFSFCVPVVSGFLWFPAPGALGLGAVCFWVGLPLLRSSCALVDFVFSAWPLVAPWWLHPLPCPFCVLRSRRCRSVPPNLFLSSASLFLPACLALVSGSRRLLPPPPPPPLLFVLLVSSCWALRALSVLLCFPPGRWLLPGG